MLDAVNSGGTCRILSFRKIDYIFGIFPGIFGFPLLFDKAKVGLSDIRVWILDLGQYYSGAGAPINNIIYS